MLVVEDPTLIGLMRVIGSGGGNVASRVLEKAPELAVARLERSEEFFIAECHAQLYAGDTALHVAACAYDSRIAAQLVAAGADVRARNRRGGEPLHAAVTGVPGSSNWNPQRQADVIRSLIEMGADPNAPAVGGVTPLHRAVRNRCSAAVQALLDGGADVRRTNDSGSTALTLAQWTTGRGGSGSPEARVEQDVIVRMLAAAAG